MNPNLTHHTGLVLEGGGFRAIFVAAALEILHKHALFFQDPKDMRRKNRNTKNVSMYFTGNTHILLKL
jgi:Predicted esterase of the alpha-beta hydrolase superfamily